MIEYEEASETEEDEAGETLDEKNARIDAELDALREKYGICDEEREPSPPEQIWRSREQSKRLEELQKESEEEQRRWEEQEKEWEEERQRNVVERQLLTAISAKHRARRRALLRARDSPPVPSRGHFDLLAR